MAEPFLKNRRRFTSSLDNHLAARTRIPESWLLDEAISDLLLKHSVQSISGDEKKDNQNRETDMKLVGGIDRAA